MTTLSEIHEAGEGSCSTANVQSHTEPGHAHDESIGNKIAKRETRTVARLRAVVLFSLIAAMVTVSVFVFSYTRNREEEDFEEAFLDSSNKIVGAFQSGAERRLSSIASFGATITSYAIGTNATWPFVTIPQMEHRCSHLLNLADTLTIAFAPIVHAQDRNEWENEFVPANVGWAEESFAYLETTQYTSESHTINDPSKKQEGGDGGDGGDGVSSKPPPTYEGMPDYSRGYSKQILSFGITPLGSLGPLVITDDGPYMPWWQRAPSPRHEGVTFVNIDLRDDPSFDGNLLQVLQSKKAALGNMAIGKYESVDKGPSSGFYYPILKDSIDSDDNPVVGSLATLVVWNKLFLDILPKNVVGLFAVVKNTCEQVYTFRIDGPNAVFLGDGDLHDPKYDQMSQEVSFTSLVQAGIEAKTYLGFPVDTGGCQYTLTVYASSDMEDEYVTKMPYVYMVGSILIFLFTSLIFVVYDRLVERRQRLVLREAKKSGAIVSSLFPTAYMERLMREEEEKLKGTQSVETKGSLLTSFMNGEGLTEVRDDEPMADLFSDCTVLFADIAVSCPCRIVSWGYNRSLECTYTCFFFSKTQGFTEWSDKRTPSDVFTLLQTVYGGFDKLARKRRVFKVETIGDCYLAVTGLPDPQADHALIMAKYANECILQMNETTRNLVERLGEDTANLSLRIGINSGSVTAGVLRGEKSRFQLFGDTVSFFF